MSNIGGSGSGLFTEPPELQKPSGTVTISILGLLLPTYQGKHLPRSQLQGTIFAGLPGMGAGVCIGGDPTSASRNYSNCSGRFLTLPT